MWVSLLLPSFTLGCYPCHCGFRSYQSLFTSTYWQTVCSYFWETVTFAFLTWVRWDAWHHSIVSRVNSSWLPYLTTGGNRLAKRGSFLKVTASVWVNASVCSTGAVVRQLVGTQGRKPPAPWSNSWAHNHPEKTFYTSLFMRIKQTRYVCGN